MWLLRNITLGQHLWCTETVVNSSVIPSPLGTLGSIDIDRARRACGGPRPHRRLSGPTSPEQPVRRHRSSLCERAGKRSCADADVLPKREEGDREAVNDDRAQYNEGYDRMDSLLQHFGLFGTRGRLFELDDGERRDEDRSHTHLQEYGLGKFINGRA